MTKTDPGKKPVSPPAWDSEDPFLSKNASFFTAEQELIGSEIEGFVTKYQGAVSKLNGQQLAVAIGAFEHISEQIERIRSSAFLISAANIQEREWALGIEGRLASFRKRLLFFTCEMNALSEEDLIGKFNEPQLSRYSAWIALLRSGRQRMLDHDLESYVHEKSAVAEEAWTGLFDMISSDMRCQVRGQNFTKSETLCLMKKSGDALLRGEAYAALGHALGKDNKRAALILNTCLELRALEDTRRGSACAQTASPAGEVMFKTVREACPRLMSKYYAWKARKTGSAKVHPADCHASLPGDPPFALSWGRVRDIIIKAYRQFSPELADIGGQFFDGSWIDAEPRTGKSDIALSHPTVPSAHPYIIMSYEGGFHDVETLACELGRGIQQQLAGKQGYLNAALPPVLAEAGAGFGGMLVFQALLAGEDDLIMQRVLISARIEMMLEALSRQAVQVSFEQKIYKMHQAQGELSAEQIESVWLEARKEILGPTVMLNTEGAEHFWIEAIPSLLTASSPALLGLCLSNTLYAEFLQAPDRDGFVQKYIGLLKAGGTKRYDMDMAAFGLDLSGRQCWERGFSLIEQQIDALIALDLKIENIQKMQESFRNSGNDITADVPPPARGSKPSNPQGPRI